MHRERRFLSREYPCIWWELNSWTVFFSKAINKSNMPHARNHLQSIHNADNLEPTDLFSKCQTFNTHSEDSQLKSLECVTSQQQAALRLGVSHLLGWSEYLTPIFTFKSDWEGSIQRKIPETTPYYFHAAGFWRFKHRFPLSWLQTIISYAVIIRTMDI